MFAIQSVLKAEAMSNLRRKVSVLRLSVFLVAGAMLAACQTVAMKTTGTFEPPPPGSRVVLMTPDVVLSELQAAGLEEPKAEWTAAAKEHIRTEIDHFLVERHLSMVRYTEPSDPAELTVHNRLINLHGAVGNALVLHTLLPNMQLPTKKDKFDWSLGPNVAHLREDFDSDLALFIYIRDSYSSAGRAALVMAGLLLGAPVQGGHQRGFASLVDLRTGDIVWFNRIQLGVGDLREPESAKKVVEGLLTDIPL